MKKSAYILILALVLFSACGPGPTVTIEVCVILSCYINRVGDYVGSLIWRRYSDSVKLARVTMVHTGGIDSGGVCVLLLDSEQRLKYVAPAGTTTKYVKILGYW